MQTPLPAIIVNVNNAAGLPVTDDPSTVTLTLSGGVFANGGTTAAAPVVNGAATFANLVITSPGSYTITASDGALPSIVSNPFTAYYANLLTTFAPYPMGRQVLSNLVMDASGNLFGTTSYGGIGNGGEIFEIAKGTTALTTFATFDPANGICPVGGLTLDASGNFFGSTQYGGPLNIGSVFEIVHGTNVITTIATFNNSTGANPSAGVTLDASGDIFGTTYSGGASGEGTVFEIVHGTNAITTLASFNGTNGGFPASGVTLDAAGNLFGTTWAGSGTVFEIPRGATTIVPLVSFTNSAGHSPSAGLTIDSAGNLFGTTQYGPGSASGTVFEIASGTSALTTLATFNGVNGAYPADTLTLDASGDVFGTTPYGGAGNAGTVFEIVRGSSVVTTLASFNSSTNSSTGAAPSAGVTFDSSGNLFGATTTGGAFNNGTVFEIPKGTTTLATLDSLTSVDGGYPDVLALDGNGNLIGSTYRGGPNNDGTLYEIRPGSNTRALLASFNGVNGANPYGNMVFDAGGNLFGTTYSGGASGYGTVFEVVQGSSAITLLASFNNTNGSRPQAALVLDANGDLFGTTDSGGAYSDGTVYEIAHGTSVITTLVSFNGSNGSDPVGGVILDAGGNLFGTTYSGGTSGYGTVFEIPSGTTTVATIASFNGTNGESPQSSLTLDASGNLFGTTTRGGANSGGTVFEIGHGTNAITTLAPLPTPTGVIPNSSALTFDSNGNLFGTISYGGIHGYGMIFEIPAGTSTLIPFYSFDDTNGRYPNDGVLFDSSGDLFLCASNGGPNNAGTVLELTQAPLALSYTQPLASPTTAGAPINGSTGVQVSVNYNWGNPVTTDSSTITLTLSGGLFSTGINTATATAVNGVATFPGLTINTPGNYTLTASDGIFTTATASLLIIPVGPTLSASQVGGGSVQRSSIQSINVTFNEAVNFPTGAFTLLQLATNPDSTVNTAVAATDVSAAVTATSADGLTWTLSVNAGGILDRTALTSAAGLFADGIYQLVLHGSLITDAATSASYYNGKLDQVVSFASAEAGGASNYFHVLYGDANGDGSVNLTDYRQLKLDYLSSAGDPNFTSAFDFDGDGSINLTDYRQFKTNYLNSFSY